MQKLQINKVEEKAKEDEKKIFIRIVDVLYGEQLLTTEEKLRLQQRIRQE